jgi:hypothetical protein
MALNTSLRERLAKPFGEVLGFEQVSARLGGAAQAQPAKRPAPLIAVGDQIIVNLLQASLVPDIAVYDNICQRKEVPKEWTALIRNAALREGGSVRAPNPPGTIHPKMEARVRDVLGIGAGWVELEGEDDLASLVVMAYAPKGSLLLYGQPNQGVVWTEIDEKRQKEAQSLLREIKQMK